MTLLINYTCTAQQRPAYRVLSLHWYYSALQVSWNSEYAALNKLIGLYIDTLDYALVYTMYHN